MELILNEKKYAEELLATGNIGKKPSVAIKLLVRYCYHEQDLRKKKIIAEIDGFMTQYYRNWNLDEWIKTITRYIGIAKKYPLLQIDYIAISSSEMEKIQSLNNEQLEKMLFTAVCIAKYYSQINPLNSNWVNLTPTQLFKLANQSGSKRDKLLRVHYLKNLGLITPSIRCDNTNIFVNMINNADEAYKITSINDLGNTYMVLTEKGFYCRKCGKYEKQNKCKTKKYCKSCISPAPVKQIVCEDCGRIFEVSNRDSRTTRCPECYADYRKAYKATKEAERRKKSVDRPSED